MYLQVITTMLVWVCSFGGHTEPRDFKQIFKNNWTSAERYVEKQRQVWNVIFNAFSVPADLAVAVVFPEQIRYSALQNIMETAAIKALYVQGGTRMANFSIGRFQMKPSFAEEVEREWMQTEWRHYYGIYFDLSDSMEARRARIRRLDDVQWQCIYLSLFVKLLYRRCPQLAKDTAAEQVRFCATAYNVSFKGSYGEIRGKSRKAFFHTDFMASSSTVYYAYPDIAVYYYLLLKHV
ncbi:hypothetical protein [Bacteroides sp. UBA939]|uniref:hypothetical protein n=1 Tax=Bacteroides sp. UBA939 TaxID=1946092 RepID=UPI0025C389DD|nr:hypothetical protein [Bacteroides sp. UBA939]